MADKHGLSIRYLALFVVLLWPAVSAAEVPNGSFEQAYTVTPYPDSVPQFWRLKNPDHTMFGSQVTPVWKTEGVRSTGLFSRYGRSFTAGNSQGICQLVDLTGMAALVFDVRLAAYGSTVYTWFDNFEAAVLVDDRVLWTQTADGTYVDQQVNISQLPGLHRVELRSTAKNSGKFNVAYWVQWDNLRLVKMPEETIIEGVVDVDPNTLNLASQGKWITCYIELPDGYDVNDIDAGTVTLENIGAYTGEEGWASAGPSAGNITDHDGDRVMERMVKFDRSAVGDVLRPGPVTVTVMAKLPNRTVMHATDAIKVIGSKGGNSK
jgi:hypothetical protein